MELQGKLGMFLLVMGILSSGCGDEPTKVGNVCQTDQHCGGTEATFQLFCDNSIPGGYCTIDNCIMDDPETEDIAEDKESCPEGSRCVREGEDSFLCRKECSQQNDCGEVIVCRANPEEIDECIEDCTDDLFTCDLKCGSNSECLDECAKCVEKCEDIVECKNEMECAPFWDLPLEDTPDDAPRACILKNRKYEADSD